MITIHPESLNNYLIQQIHTCYLLLGNDTILLQDSINTIIQNIKTHYLCEQYFYTLTQNTDVDHITIKHKKKTLFSKKKIMCIQIQKQIFLKRNQTLDKLSQISTQDIILIIYCDKNITIEQQKNIFNYLKFKAITIDCNIVNIHRLTQWIHFKILEKHIKLDPSAIKVLAQCYYGNTLELIQIINMIYLIWPNQYVSTSQIKNIISNSVQYSIFEWIHAIFNNNKKKSIKILDKLLNNKCHPLSLIRTLQNDLILLITMIRNKKKFDSLPIYKKHIWKHRSILFRTIHFNTNIKKIHKFIHSLALIEIAIKTNNNKNIWNQLKNLSLILDKS